ncbi:hypothetical protein [Ekhidna sp.]|uniref:hypothetical protein n=1 Tax=Ekhidna sp. TaxID=2608089 RepID=UPI003515E4A9
MKNQLKYLLSGFIIASVILLSSCGGDDAGPAYNFIDQNLQGTIDGQNFVYGEGIVEASSFNEGKFSLDLYDEQEEITDICDFFGFGDHVSIFFEIPDEIGLYELFLNLESFEGQTVTLFNPDGSQNNIATMGAVEILSISATQVKGRMDARMDEANSVNGNFTVQFCPEN